MLLQFINFSERQGALASLTVPFQIKAEVTKTSHNAA